MDILAQAEAILAANPKPPPPLMDALPFNTCHLDHEYCLYQKKCSDCPKNGGKRCLI